MRKTAGAVPVVLSVIMLFASFTSSTAVSETPIVYLRRAFAPSFDVTPVVQNVHFLFQIDDVDLGSIYPNSSVTATLHLRYNATAYTLKSLAFSEPFQSWFVQGNFSQNAYLPYNGVNGSADFNLTFDIPADIAAGSYSGNISFSADDRISDSGHTSSAKISAAVGGVSQGLVVAVLIASVAVAAVAGLLVYFKKRRREAQQT